MSSSVAASGPFSSRAFNRLELGVDFLDIPFTRTFLGLLAYYLKIIQVHAPRRRSGPLVVGVNPDLQLDSSVLR